MIEHVEDPADPRLADYVGLTDPELRRHREHGDGFFVVEGPLAIERLAEVHRDWEVRSVLVTPKQLDRLGSALDLLDAPVLVAPPEVLREVVGFDLHRGAVASVHRPDHDDPAALLRSATLALVVEGVNDHENLGGLFRNAAAFGADAVLLDPTTADPLYRRAVRVSMGHVLAVPFARLPALPDGLAVLTGAGFTTVALTPSGDERLGDLPAAGVDGLGRVAVLVGAEGHGLADATLAAADRRVRIAMAPGVDSLNVATAAAVALHHLAPALT